MAKQPENASLEPSPGERSEQVADMRAYEKRFEAAVEDAQYLLIYASSNCPNDIKRSTLEKLIIARRRIENNEEVNAKEEADFWLAYQELWKLVKPVTAESVKANLPLENTLISKLLGRNPSLSRWLGKRTVTKARGTVNRYIAFTVFVLAVLLIMQIYWVIGNQLTTQLTDALQKEADLSLQLNKNQQEYTALEIVYKQNEIDSESYKSSGTYTFYSSPQWERDTLENVSARAQLESDLESLKSQLDRSSAILLIWSSPWQEAIDKGTETGNSTANDKYEAQIASINLQLNAINKQLKDDPDGTIAAGALNSIFEQPLKDISDQAGVLYAKNDAIDAKEADINRQIDNIDNQLSSLSSTGNTQSDLDARVKDLNEQTTGLQSIKADLEAQIQGIRDQLGTLSDNANAGENLKSTLEAQLADLQSIKADHETQIQAINEQLSALSDTVNAGGSLKTTLEAQLNDLKQQLNDLNETRRVNVDQIKSLQSQSNGYLAQLVPAGQIVGQWNQDKQRLTDDLNALLRQQLADEKRENSRQAQLAGQFVLVVLQSYLLPLLYGILGASTSVLRTLSKQINSVTYSEEAGVQHLLRISLGALAGIMVGWFSFLLPNESSSFLGQVSPLAIAFLVGYNIELFFSMMDIALNKVNEMRQKSSPTTATEASTTVSETDSNLTPTEETASDETSSAKEESVG